MAPLWGCVVTVFGWNIDKHTSVNNNWGGVEYLINTMLMLSSFSYLPSLAFGDHLCALVEKSMTEVCLKKVLGGWGVQHGCKNCSMRMEPSPSIYVYRTDHPEACNRTTCTLASSALL